MLITLPSGRLSKGMSKANGPLGAKWRTVAFSDTGAPSPAYIYLVTRTISSYAGVWGMRKSCIRREPVIRDLKPGGKRANDCLTNDAFKKAQ